MEQVYLFPCFFRSEHSGFREVVMVGLAALSSSTQDVTVRFENLAQLQQLVAMRERQTASYKIDSVLYVTSGEEKLDIKTSNSGSVDLRSLVK